MKNMSDVILWSSVHEHGGSPTHHVISKFQYMLDRFRQSFALKNDAHLLHVSMIRFSVAVVAGIFDYHMQAKMGR